MLEISKLYAPKFAVEEFKNCLQGLIENAEGPVTYDIPSKDLVGDGLSNQLWVGHRWEGSRRASSSLEL